MLELETETNTGSETAHEPRLAPIEHPKGLILRLAYWGTQRKFGKVMTPLKVVTARVPESAKLTMAIQKFQMKGLTLDQELQLLIADQASTINGCSFCLDLGRAMALRSKMGLEKFQALEEYRTSPLFTERERAALAYVEEATRNKKVTDATFETLRKHFSEREIVEITLINAIENLYNLTNLPLGIGSDGFCAIPSAPGARSAEGRAAWSP